MSILYQIVTDRFADGNPHNMPAAPLHDPTGRDLKKYLGGDWAGIIEAIERGYFNALGVTSLLISPHIENIHVPLRDREGSTSYHGYWPRDFKRTNPAFGTLEEFRRLIAVAHAHGLRLIIDFPANHTSPQRVEDPTYGENGRLYDDGKLLGGYTNDVRGLFQHLGTTDFSCYEKDVYQSLYDLGDFDLMNPLVERYLAESISFWLEMGVDGVRIDAAKHIPSPWLKSFLDHVHRKWNGLVLLEWYTDGFGRSYPTHEDGHYGRFTHRTGASAYDYCFSGTVRAVLRDRTEPMSSLPAMIRHTQRIHRSPHILLTFLDNNDMDRFHQDGQSPLALAQALVLLFTSRGIPMLYYGTEQGMTGNGDPTNRRPLTSQRTDSPYFHLLRALAELRKTNASLASGETISRYADDDVWVYERVLGEHRVLCMINRSETKAYHVPPFVTLLPAGVYSDQLQRMFGGRDLEVRRQGIVAGVLLEPGETCVFAHESPHVKPEATHVTPGFAAPGRRVIIEGVGFGTRAGQVFLGSSCCPIVEWNDTQIEIGIPAMQAGLHHLRMVTRAGDETRLSSEFEVTSGPLVTVRFIVRNALHRPSDSLYVLGDVHELGQLHEDLALGPFFHQVIVQKPDAYFDVALPADRSLSYRFLRRVHGQRHVERGPLQHLRTPKAGVLTIDVEWHDRQTEHVHEKRFEEMTT